MKQDIIIIGGGPAGLCFAKDVCDANLNVLLIEKQSKKTLADPPYDGREIALTHLSQSILNNLGIWELIPDERISLIKTAKVLNGKSSYALSFNYQETSADNLGFMVSNNLIKKASYESVEDADNIKIMDNTQVTKIGSDQEQAWVEIEGGERLNASLIVSADSRFSTTRSMVGIPTSIFDFGRTCIVCTMQVELPHNDTAYECFHFDRTLAVLPMNNNQVSIVITLKSEECNGVLSMTDEDFSKDIEYRIEGRFGAMKLTSKLFPYPLVASHAKTFYANRYALIGDAAVGMHPVTAHGFNLGLRSAHALSEEIKTALHTGYAFSSQATLERYNRRHRRVSLPLYHGTNALVRLYTKETRTAKIMRRSLLRLGNRIGPAKRLIMDQLTELNAK
tara:strand:+ start:55109 stop:56287 length:1179 start_codon:yes stop_codon:yes gene_type:complete